MLPQLNFPDYQFSLRKQGDRYEILDPVRKKWLVLTPEEWVRQHWVSHLINRYKFPASLLAVEKSFNLNGLKKRFDLMAGHPPKVLIECKAPEIALSQQTFDQIARYNLILKVPFLIISNGIDHWFFEMDPEQNGVKQLQDLPDFHQITNQ